MPFKKKRKSISESSGSVSKPTSFGIPEEVIPNVPALPPPGQAVCIIFTGSGC